MATFTLLEFATLTEQGERVEPEYSRKTAQPFGTPVRLQSETKYYQVIPDVDARLRVSDDGAAAGAGDRKIYADIATGARVALGARPYVNLSAA